MISIFGGYIRDYKRLGSLSNAEKVCISYNEQNLLEIRPQFCASAEPTVVY